LIIEHAGRLQYVDVVEGITCKTETDDQTGKKEVSIIETKDRTKMPSAQILDADGNVKDGYGYPIDQIFVKRNAFTVHSYDVLNYLIDGKFSSDHFPIVVELSLN
jgi:DNA-directed RNA polymerase subunit beta'